MAYEKHIRELANEGMKNSPGDKKYYKKFLSLPVKERGEVNILSGRMVRNLHKSHAKSVALHKKIEKEEPLNAWGQSPSTAKRVRKELREAKKMKSFKNHASERFDAGY